MRSSLFKFFILLSLGLIALLLNACALDGASDPSDPPGWCPASAPIQVTPDTYIPSTLRVCVMVTENQDASDGMYGSSDVTVQFYTNEITNPPNTVIFPSNGEDRIECLFNGVQTTTNLGNAPDYHFHVRMNTIPISYECNYLQPQESPVRIFQFTDSQLSLSPALVRPVTNASSIEVSYIPGSDITNASTCMLRTTANENASNGSALNTVTGATEPQSGNLPSRSIYTNGPNVTGFTGPGNIVMTRTCTPVQSDNHNSLDDQSQIFDAVNVTYTSTASSEVTWVF